MLLFIPQSNGLNILSGILFNKNVVYFSINIYTHLDSHLEELFMADKNAWTFFIKQAPSYRKTRIHWVMSAKQELTRIARLNKLIIACDNNKRLF